MTEYRNKNNSRGFSLIETLAVVAIIGILLGLSAVAAAYYRNLLKINELDNAAREIYMAAENRAVLLDSGGQLDGVLTVTKLAAGGPADSEWMDRDEVTKSSLLLSGAIDPALLKGDFRIIYDPVSHAVTDVFYSESEIKMTQEDALKIAGDRDARMKLSPMLGYYGGQLQEREEYTPLPAPEVMVVVRNGDRLTVDVTFSVPSSAVELVGGDWVIGNGIFNKNVKADVTLIYQGKEVQLMSGSEIKSSRKYTCSLAGVYPASSVTFTWVLDALDQDGTQDSHFWQLFDKSSANAPPCGDDFTVTAQMVLSAPGRRSTSASGSDRGNSLFAERSGGDVARLENLRHLQNLDTQTSNVDNKNSAVLLADISCLGTAPGKDPTPENHYQFRPIVNEDLRSFDGGQATAEDGQPHEITDLLVTPESADGKKGAGLFATTFGTTSEPVKFTGVRLVNPQISAGVPAGALVGRAGSGNEFTEIYIENGQITCTSADSSAAAAGGVVGGGNNNGAKNQRFSQVQIINTSAVCQSGAAGGVAGRVSGQPKFTGCQVYWEPEEGEDNLRSLLGSDKTQYNYQIVGKYAGGLVGHFAGATATSNNDTCEISHSFASSMVRGEEYAGGLLGYSKSVEIKAQNSYADCYLQAPQAAGLIGNTSNTTTIKNCYAAGFITATQAAAGLCLGDVLVTTESTYAALAYPNSTGTIYPLVQRHNSNLTKSYYLEDPLPSGAITGPGEGKDYNAMTDKGFLSSVGGAFAFKTVASDTNPYNLREKQKLNPPYSFPGLKDLPHYGDWQAYFKEPSLVYYEEYSTIDPLTKEPSRGFSGGNARELIGELDENVTVKTDGYAVALLKKDLPASNSFTVTYNYFDADGQPRTLSETYYTDGGTGSIKLLGAKWVRTEGGAPRTDEYWLAPLPNELVIGETTGSGEFRSPTTKDFYQYLQFETDIVLDNGGAEGKMAAGEYFYNPHFAETVKPYVPEEEGQTLVTWEDTGSGWKPKDPDQADAAIQNYIKDQLLRKSNSVSVRTPRHFFHLSQYENYYSNDSLALAFHQDLPLDGGKGVYTGYPGLLEYEKGDRDFQLQAPIGSLQKPFLGTYNGNRLTIQRLAFQITDDTRSSAGLFGASAGTLTDIVYQLAPETEMRRTVVFNSSHQTTYLGALVGYNRVNGTIRNCAVSGVNLTTVAATSTIYIGGLAGANDGTIQNCGAESALLHVDVSNYGRAYVGGLVGWNVSSVSGRVSRSYAVGRLSAQVPEANSSALLAGFAGRNSGGISDCYSAMDLKTDGVGAAARGFCGLSDGGWQNGTFYLNSGNFTYRDEDFLASYEDDRAKPLTYVELTANPSPVSGMGKVDPDPDPENTFPYPAAVSGDKGLTHYGDWPRAMELGTMGVYYWEELQIPGKEPSYHVSLLAVDPGENAQDAKTITKLSTLSTAHDEGGEVTRFGYGIYHKREIAVKLEKTTLPLLYSDNGEKGVEFNDGKFQALKTAKETATDSSPLGLDRQVDETLAGLMDYELDKEGEETQFQFNSFHSYGLDGSLGGLYPNASTDTPNGTLTLSEGSNQNLKVTFALNPLFAGALAVEKPNGDWEPAEDVPTFTVSGTKLTGGTPGSEKNPYGVRSIAQLQLIDWNSQFRNTDTVLGEKADANVVDTVDHFPYLSSDKDTGKYFWKQSYDIIGEKSRQSADKGYTPIAEYYDTNGGETGKLTGWFGGSYDGGTYSMKDVYITGQKSSCAGLFGVVYDGSLENIVLYSSDGEGIITTKAAGEMVDDGSGKLVRKNATESRWFAIGGLAGVAGTSDPNSNAIRNCAVAGYTILAEVYTFAGSDGDWGGNNIGGLVGASHMNLSNCTAETDVIVKNAVENDNMRVGGLAGTCQGTVQNCYAGGSIQIDSKTVTVNRSDRGIYVGGLVGGSYMKPLEVGDTGKFIGTKGSGTGGNAQNDTNNTLRSCYSYVTLPPLTGESAHQQIKSMYVIGGTGELYPKESPGSPDLANHGVTTYDNCYFFTSESLANYGGSVDTYLAAVGDRKAKTDVGEKTPDTIIYKDTYKVPAKTEETITRGWFDSWNDPYDSNRTVLNGTTYYYTGSLKKGTSLYYKTADSYDGWNAQYYRTYTFVGWYDGSGFRDWSKGDEILSTIPGVFTPNPNVTGLTYEQLAGMQKGIPGKDQEKNIYDLLNEGKTVGTDAFFHEVTTTTKDGLSVPGKYSYPTAKSPQLKDRDYPFPTILTQGEGEDIRYVHYGDWPLKGFRRQTPFDGDGKYTLLGGSPIDVDLFVNKLHEEHLVLTEGVAPGGQWTFTWGSGTDDPIAEVKISENPLPDTELPDGEKGKSYYLFTLDPKRDGTDILNISYTVNGNTYTLPVTVHITADVELRPNRLFLFPGDTVEVGFRATDKEGQTLAVDGEPTVAGELLLKGNPNCGSEFLTAVTLNPKETEDEPPTVQFTTSIPMGDPELEKDTLTLGANTDFSYTVPGQNGGQDQVYGGGTGGDIRVEIIQLWKDQKDLITFEEVELEDGSKQVVCTITFPDSFRVGEEGTLRFAQGVDGEPTVTPMPKKPTAEWIETENSISLKLTYPKEVTSLADLPDETVVSIPLDLTSGETDGELIEGIQHHILTLKVVKPEILPEEIQP